MKSRSISREDRCHELGPADEVVIEATSADAGTTRHLGGADTLIAVLNDQFTSRLNDLHARGIAAFLVSTHMATDSRSVQLFAKESS